MVLSTSTEEEVERDSAVDEVVCVDEELVVGAVVGPVVVWVVGGAVEVEVVELDSLWLEVDVFRLAGLTALSI